MGLDAVEIVMEVEDTFDISLEDAEAERILTPRALIETVLAKVGRSDVTGCLTQRSFNLLRAALLRRLPLKRRDVAPAVPLATLVPRSRREGVLKELAAELKTGPLPSLVRAPWLITLLSVQSAAIGVAVGVALPRLVPAATGGGRFWVGVLAALVAHCVAWFATQRFCTEFPPLVATVGDLTRWVMAHKTDLASPAPGSWTREQVAQRVREIVVEKLDCAASYREDASFIKDLGLS